MLLIKMSLLRLIEILQILILIRCVLSWFMPRGSSNVIMMFLYRITDPILAPIQKAMYRNMQGGMGIDFSPIIAFILLRIIAWVIMIVM